MTGLDRGLWPRAQPERTTETEIVVSTLNLTLVLFGGLFLVLVVVLVMAGLAYVTHRHPRLEKPLTVAFGGGGVLVAVVVGLVAVVALTT
ncbi:hypothetical protein ACFRH6_35450 [Streptomyces sp. NPDC056749]|uniref:hypothetical protein n=1 Tax=Streptomyces sp. NPDC056749 TaxID=3345936 RepID=UPI0036B78CAD